MLKMMCLMMLVENTSAPQVSTGPTHPMGGDGPPLLQNLLIENFGPYNSASQTSGDFKFDRRFEDMIFVDRKNSVFDEFGKLHNAGKADEYPNPAFEYRLPPDIQLFVPIDGVVDMVTWQPTSSYKQDDWEIFLKPWRGSSWIVVIDHVVSIDCDRSSTAICDLPLTIDGQELQPGMQVRAGQVLGYPGNWVDQSGANIVGRTELTVMEYKDGVSYNKCPTRMLAEAVKEALQASVTAFMEDYESWSGSPGKYAQDDMVAPGCLYTGIDEVDGRFTPIP